MNYPPIPTGVKRAIAMGHLHYGGMETSTNCAEQTAYSCAKILSGSPNRLLPSTLASGNPIFRGGDAMLMALAAVFGLIAFVAAVIILIHAFRASVGQGLLSLCVPFYIFYYGFARFQHPKKNLILGAMIGGWVVAAILYVVGGAAALAGLTGGP
jgi:hypothetical protein